MRRFLPLATLLAFLAGPVVAQDVTINFAGGNIYQSDGTTLAAPGSLLQIIVSRGDDVFSAPSPDSFTGDSADDFVLASFEIDNAFGTNGTFAEGVTFTLSGTLGTGDNLLLRWFPSLTLSASSPGAGTSYGQFRTDIIDSDNGSDIAWEVPSAPSTSSLNFLTQSQGGSSPESAGVANLTVIPEPSTYVLLGMGAVGALWARRRSRASV